MLLKLWCWAKKLRTALTECEWRGLVYILRSEFGTSTTHLHIAKLNSLHVVHCAKTSAQNSCFYAMNLFTFGLAPCFVFGHDKDLALPMIKIQACIAKWEPLSPRLDR